MKKIIKQISILITILSFILFSKEIIESIKFSFNICFNNLFPSLIPFMLFSNIILNYNIIFELNNIFDFLMKKFKVSKNVSFIFIMSIFSGIPSNAMIIYNALKNNTITINDANKSLKFCHFLNPIFILNTIGYQFLGNKILGIKILFSHYISNIILGLLYKNKNFYHNYKKIDFPKFENKNKNFFEILKESILNISNTLILILGIITFFLILTTLIDQIIKINTNFKFIFGILEITQGLKYLSYSTLNINIKAIIASFLISFGGLCIHLQTFCTINNNKVRYGSYFVTRILHGILSSFLTYIFIKY